MTTEAKGVDVRMVYAFDMAKVPAVIKAAYALSSPQGLGFLHFKPEPLSDAEVAEIMSRSNRWIVANMDYVNGRSIKLGIYQAENGSCYIHADRWYDHSAEQLRELACLADLGEPQPNSRLHPEGGAK